MDFREGPLFQHLRHLNDDRELTAAVVACVESAKAATADDFASRFRAAPDAAARVSEEALERAMAGGDVSDIRTEGDLSNCLVFHTGGLDGSVMDARVVQSREKLDALLSARVRELIGGVSDVELLVSGQLWYPPGGYMGWHTNSRVPGWRLYVTYVEEPRRSFFRYRDPETGDVVTSWDDGWDLRAFRVDAERPLWHAVYSETNRFSFGYRFVPKGSIRRPSRTRRIVRRLRRR